VRPAAENLAPVSAGRTRTERALLISGILFSGLLLRAAFLASLPGTPLENLLFLDALSYHNWARKIAAGDWLGHEPFHMAPLYPYLLGVIYRLFGEGIAAKIAQAGLGVLNAVLLYLIAERAFGRTTALLAFLLSLLYGPFLFYEIQLLNTTLALTLALSAVLLLDRGIARRAGREIAFAGLLLGLGMLVRPEFLLFAPLAVGAILLARGEARERGRLLGRAARGARHAALFAAMAALPLAISGARNALVAGDFVLISHHGGISFYMGNNEFTDGTYRPPPYFQGTPEAIDQRDSRRFAEKEAGRALRASEVDRFWYGKAFAYIREHPFGYARLLARKLALYWGDYEIPLNASWDFFRRLSPILAASVLSFGLIVPLAAIGAGAACAGRNPRALLPALFVLANMAAVTIFFVCDRYRQPAVPFLVAFAAAGLARLAGLARARRARPLALGVAAVLALGALLHVRLAGNPSLSFARSHVAIGQAALRRGDRAAAERAFRDAIRENPLYIDAMMNLGALYQDEKRFGDAVAAYESVLRVNPEFAGAHLNRGSCAQAQGRLDEALADYARAESADPYLPAAPNNAGTALEALGRRAEAEAAYRRAIEDDPGFLDARANLARVLESEGRLEEALAEYREVLARVAAAGPTGGGAVTAAAAEARIADLLGALGRFAEAEPHYRRALAAAPPTAERLVNLGVTLIRLGRRDEARSVLERAARDFPDSPDAALNFANLLLESGEAARAAAALEAAAARFPSDPRFPYGRAAAAALAGDRVAARAALAEAIRLGGDAVRAAAARDPRLADLVDR
jgi:tetratricopeptide (TPR) repeat protein